MLDLEVILEFSCCSCGDPLGVTVKCASQNLDSYKNQAASVKVPCPNCKEINQAIFSPDDGALIHVAISDKSRYMIPVPSLN
jgi:phage FluMu protein Com